MIFSMCEKMARVKVFSEGYAVVRLLLIIIGIVSVGTGKGVENVDKPPLQCVLAIIGDQPEDAKMELIGSHGSLAWGMAPPADAAELLRKYPVNVKLLYMTVPEMRADFASLTELETVEAITRRLAAPDIPVVEAFETVACATVIPAVTALKKRDASGNEDEKMVWGSAADSLSQALYMLLNPFPQSLTSREAMSYLLEALVGLIGFEKDLAAANVQGMSGTAKEALSAADALYADLARCSTFLGDSAYERAKLVDVLPRICIIKKDHPLLPARMKSLGITFETWRDYYLVPLRQTEIRPGDPVILYFTGSEKSVYDARHTETQIERFRLRRLERRGPDTDELVQFILRQRLYIVASLLTLMTKEPSDGPLLPAVRDILHSAAERELADAAGMMYELPVLLDGIALPETITVPFLLTMLSPVGVAVSATGLESLETVADRVASDFTAADVHPAGNTSH